MKSNKRYEFAVFVGYDRSSPTVPMRAWLRSLDCFLVFSVLFLVILIPIGFTIDKLKLECECEEVPTLYLFDELKGSIPQPFRDFVESAQTEIDVVLSDWHPRPVNLREYVELFTAAVKRGVTIKIITNSENFSHIFNFCEIHFVKPDTAVMFAFMGQADRKRTMFASNLFITEKANISDTGSFYLDFRNCRSIASDVKSLISMLEYYSSSGFPEIFFKKWVPGSSFPKVHSLPDGGDVVIAVSPPRLTAPGRLGVDSMVVEFFTNYGGNMSLVTESLIPPTEAAGTEMPELLLSERIGLAALNGTNIRILGKKSEVQKSESQVRSLLQFPNTELRMIETDAFFPTFYTYNDESGFMPLPFEKIVANQPITFAFKVHNSEIAAKLNSHFEDVWEKSKKFT